jgi:hypothetical protein
LLVGCSLVAGLLLVAGGLMLIDVMRFCSHVWPNR